MTYTPPVYNDISVDLGANYIPPTYNAINVDLSVGDTPLGLVHGNRIAETTITEGTGTYTYGGAVAGYKKFVTLGGGNTCHYLCKSGDIWEIGLGTITATGLERTTLIESTNADAAVDWTAGEKTLVQVILGETIDGMELAETTVIQQVADHLTDHNKFGDVEGGNYAEFESDGTLVFYGTSSTWDDINIDPTNLTGNGDLPVRTTIPGTTLSAAGFSGSKTDEVEGAFEYPHKCKLHLEDGATSVTLDFHCHVMPITTAGGNVRMGIEYGFSDETTPLTSSTTIEVTAALGTTVGLKQTIDISDTIQAPVELGTQIHMRFYRLGGDALDTSSAVVIVQTIGCHVESNLLGSREETTK